MTDAVRQRIAGSPRQFVEELATPIGLHRHHSSIAFHIFSG
jgi:hypothetical protein